MYVLQWSKSGTTTKTIGQIGPTTTSTIHSYLQGTNEFQTKCQHCHRPYKQSVTLELQASNEIATESNQAHSKEMQA